jgi:RNA polymerase primary sigma factor
MPIIVKEDEISEVEEVNKAEDKDDIDLASQEVNLSELDDSETYDEEINLSDFRGSGDAFAMYLRELVRYPLLSKEEEYNCAKHFRQYHDLESKQKLVNHNLRLVINIAKRFNNSGVTLMDLVQEGNIGLMVAVEKFDPDLGFKFSTYATWWIRQAIMRYIANSSRLIRVPVHAHEGLYKYNKFVKDWKESNYQEPLPPLSEIAKHIDISEDTLKTCIASDNIVSLSKPVGEEQDTTIGDFIADNTDITKEAEQESLSDSINQLLGSLKEREREILILRFGLNGQRQHTLEEVGQMYGVTRERIRQIEAKGLKKLKNPKKKKVLIDYLDR